MTTSFSRRIAVSPDVVFRTVADEAVLLNLKSETYLGLDPVGTRMWTALTGSESIETAYQALLGEYDVDGEQLRRDLQEFVDKLLQHQLVELIAGEAVQKGAE
jgi:hypothetical protein